MALVFKNGDYLLIRRKIGVQFSGNGNLRAFTHVKERILDMDCYHIKPISLSTLVELIEKGIVINNRIEVILLPEILLC